MMFKRADTAILGKIPYMFANLNLKDVIQFMEKEHFLLLLPLGSTEPHGPHCPLSTDISISSEACLRAAQTLHSRNCEAYVLPPMSYSIAKSAEHFSGCISISKEMDSYLISDVALSLINQGIEKICIFNSHFDPWHISAIYDAMDMVNLKTGMNLLFTDITKKIFGTAHSSV
jgi:creatinine amidohydrolase